MQQKTRKMSKEEIYSFLKEWFDKGYFTTVTRIKAETNDTANNAIEKRCVARELSYTSMAKILFVGDKTNSTVYSLFQQYCDEKRIMTTLEAKIQLNVSTSYKLHKAVENGTVLRFERDDAIIYVR